MGNYAPLSVANGFLEFGFRDEVAVDPMKIQKLCYFAHGYYIAAKDGVPLIQEGFQAWPFGPVNPTIYETFKEYGRDPITDFGKAFNYSLRTKTPIAPPETDKLFLKIRDRVWELYGKRRSMTLSDLTHKAGGAWDKTFNAADGLKNAPIPNSAIAAEFKNYVTKK